MKTQLLELTAMFVAGYCIGRYIELKENKATFENIDSTKHTETIKRYRKEKIKEGLKAIAFGIIGGAEK